MQIIKRTPEIKIQTTMLIAWIPFIWLNFYIIARFPYSQNTIQIVNQKYSIWIFSAVFLIFVATNLISKINRIGFWIFLFTLLSIIVTDFILTFRQSNYVLGFYFMFIMALAALHCISIFKLFSNAYLTPQLYWYQGHPTMIPNLFVKIFHQNETITAPLSNLDERGCFVFSKGLNQNVDRVELVCDGKFLNKNVIVVSKTSRGDGFGLKFQAKHRDDEKEIREFVDHVRSRGYVE